MLKRIQNRVQADFISERFVKIFFEQIKKIFFVIIMKTVHDFICKTNEAINIVNILSNARRNHFHGRSERSAVGFRDVFTAFKRNDVKNCFHKFGGLVIFYNLFQSVLKPVFLKLKRVALRVRERLIVL